MKIWIPIAVGAGTLVLLSRASVSSRGKPARALNENEAVAELRSMSVPVTVVADNALQYLVRVPSRLGGVVYRYMGTDRGSEVMNPRLAVLLLRLGHVLAQKRVVAVDHLGIFPGKGDDPATMHNRGFAADLSGFVFADGSKLTVLNDWARSPKFFRSVYDVLCIEGECEGLLGGNYLITPDHHDPTLASTHRDHFHVQIDHTPWKSTTNTRS